MAKTDQSNAIVDLYQWLHRHWPHFVDCTPIYVVSVLGREGFRTTILSATTIWGLPVVAALALKPSLP
jgi:hypothetical protein